MKRASAKTRSSSSSSLDPRTKSWSRELKPSSEAAETSSVAPSETGTEIELRHNIKYGRPVQACWGLFSDYCNNSTIHGMKYMGERRRPWAERLWWVIAFSFSIYLCSRLIYNVYTKWDQSPVIVSFAEKSTPVWQIPFPAVTMCPETKAQSELFNYTATYHLINQITYGNSSYNLTDDE